MQTLSHLTYRKLTTRMYDSIGLSFNDSKKPLLSSHLSARIQRPWRVVAARMGLAGLNAVAVDAPPAMQVLHPGDVVLAQRGERLETLLGSCVALILNTRGARWPRCATSCTRAAPRPMPLATPPPTPSRHWRRWRR